MPLTITVRVTTHVPGEALRIRVNVPEMEVAKMTAGRMNQVPVHELLPALVESVKPIAVNREEQIDVPLTITEPGYFRVSVTAFTEGAAPAFWDGRPVQDVSTRELWIYVNGTGGSTTETFDHTVFPDSLASVPGPLRVKRRASVRERPTAPIEGAAANTRAMSGPFQGRLVYWDATDGMYNTLVYAQVSGDYYDWYTSELVSTELTYTNASGVFGLYYDCEKWFDGLGTAWNSTFDVWDNSSRVQMSIYAGDTCPEDPGPHDFIMPNSRGGRVWSYIMGSSIGAWEFNRGQPPQTVVKIIDNGSTSYHHAFSDWIEISDQAIAGSYGAFSGPHEFGHRFQHKQLGGLSGGGQCPSPHYMDGFHNMSCAYSEGFANFFSVLTVGWWSNPSYIFTQTVLDPPWSTSNRWGRTYGYWCLNGTVGNCPGTTKDGAGVEGAFAGFLYDLARSDGDGLGYGAPYVADVLYDCQVNVNGWTRASSAEHLVACFEQRAVDYVSSGYFPTSAWPPSDWYTAASTPSGWDDDAVTARWQYNLYPIGTP
jgi:hypothetical protein